MSEQTRNTLLAAAIVVMTLILGVLILTSPTQADRVEQIGERIKCPVCQSESIANSPAQMARDMMALVEERVSQGIPDADIVNELLSSYSGAVLLDPPASGTTLILWTAPAGFLLAGIGVILWWRRHPGDPRPKADPGTQPRSARRMLVGGLILAVVIAGVVITAGAFVQEREGPNAGVADLEVEDLSEVSNETIEAVIAANVDNPQINGMRLALADRYYEGGDYRSAFPHYLAVAESPRASDVEAVTALIRLGWMAFDGNGEVETALALLDQALTLDPDSSTALYLKGRVLWCGASDSEAAGGIFSQVLTDTQLSEDSRSLVEADLTAVNSGEPCR